MEKNNFPDIKNIFHFIAVGFGSGLIRIAPGTWGSTVALILFIVAEVFIDDLLHQFIFITSLLIIFSFELLVLFSKSKSGPKRSNVSALIIFTPKSFLLLCLLCLH